MPIDLERARKALLDAITTTFSEMAFIDVDTLDNSAAPAFAGKCLTPSINILSPLKLTITLAAPINSVKFLVESLYSDADSEVDENTMQDVLAETLNTLAGCFMKKFLAEQTGYELGLPEKKFASGTVPMEAFITQFFNAMGYNFVVYLTENR